VWTLDTSTDIFLLHSVQVPTPPFLSPFSPGLAERHSRNGLVCSMKSYRDRVPSRVSAFHGFASCECHHCEAYSCLQPCRASQSQSRRTRSRAVSLAGLRGWRRVLALQAEPLGGGQLLGSGRMWVSPEGEMDPRAVKVQMEGRNLPTESLLKRYLPKVLPTSSPSLTVCLQIS
jgi:hypothetical protein